VQRVIGLPGDVWELRDGFTYINDRKLAEPYVQPDRRDTQTLTLMDIPPRDTYTRIPSGHYLLMGDNRSSSCDSRRWGVVPRASVFGTVVQILRPTP
jgi:signal peptidase I